MAQGEFSQVAGIVLAGGQSKRMGVNKALLKYKAKSFLEIQINKLRLILGFENVFVSGEGRGFPCIPDIVKNRGPVEGIRTCLEILAKFEKLFFIPVDLPLIRQETLSLLLNVASLSTADITAFQFENKELPLILRNSAELRDFLNRRHLEDLSEAKSYTSSIRHLLENVSVYKQKLSDFQEEEFFNMNRLEDYQKVLRHEL